MKGLEGFIAGLIIRFIRSLTLKYNWPDYLSFIVGFIIGGLEMVLGYYVGGGILLGIMEENLKCLRKH